tara:strand:+ start:915 stop:1448 length:534 start_codon:yes stop_codon:yes gene_type:complete
MDYTTSKLKSKVNAINNTNNYLNKIMPKINNILKSDLKLKVDGALNKKCSDKIKELLKNKPRNITIYVDDYQKHNGALKIRTMHQFEYFSEYEKENTTNYDYIEDYIYLWRNKTEWSSQKSDFIIVNTEIINDYQPRKNKSFKSVQSALNKIKKVDNKIELLNNKKSDIKKPFYRYI